MGSSTASNRQKRISQRFDINCVTVYDTNSPDVSGRNVDKFVCLFQAVEEAIILLIFEDAATLQLGYTGLFNL